MKLTHQDIQDSIGQLGLANARLEQSLNEEITVQDKQITLSNTNLVLATPFADQQLAALQRPGLQFFLQMPHSMGFWVPALFSACAKLHQITYHELAGDEVATTLIPFSWTGAWPQFLRQGEQVVTQVNFASGQMPFGMHQHVTKPVAYFTLLENPIVREWTQYKAYAAQTQNPQSLSTVLAQKQCIDNPQTRLLCGPQAMSEPVQEQHLTQALNNLQQHFLFVGIRERLNDFLRVVLTLYNLPNMCYSAVVTEAPTLDPELLEQLKAYHHLDIQLYARAKAAFANQFDRYTRVNDAVDNALNTLLFTDTFLQDQVVHVLSPPELKKLLSQAKLQSPSPE